MKKTFFPKIITLLIVFGLLLGSLPGEAFALAKDSSLPKAQADLSQTSADIMLSGTVYDGGIEGGDKHGYPLYAKITLTADGESQVLYTDPVTGTYAVPIQSAVDYSIRVEAVSRGYTVAEESFSATAALVKDFHLSILSSCTAPGYKPDYAYFYNFEGSDEGFTFIQYGSDLTWAWGEFTSGPNHAVSGNKGIATNPDGLHGFFSNGYVVSPPIDLSALSENQTAYIEWWEWIHVFSVPDQTPPAFTNVMFSRDGGNVWYEVWGERSRRQDESFQKRRIYIDSFFHVPNFQFRFYFDGDSPERTSYLDYGWYIDNIGIAITEDNLFPVTPLYTYQFDSEDEAQWTTEKVWPNVPTSWEQGVPTTGPMQAYSGANVWATNLDGNYTGEQGYLVSPVMDLSGINDKEIVIQYRDWLRTDAPYGRNPTDYGLLQVSGNQGANYQQIGLRKYRDDTIGDPYKLQKVRIEDLSYATESFQLRFGFFANRWVHELGWYIDDVSIGYSDPLSIACVKEPGALMTGYVYDQADETIKIEGVSIQSASANTKTLDWEQDPARAGLYYFFQPLVTDANDVAFELSKQKFASLDEIRTLTPSTVNQEDFYLSGGWLRSEDQAIERTIFLDDDDESYTFEFYNQGAVDALWFLSKKSVGFDPLATSELSPKLQPVTIKPSGMDDTDEQLQDGVKFTLLPAAAKYGITEAPAATSINYRSYSETSLLTHWNTINEFDVYTTKEVYPNKLSYGAFINNDYDTLYAITDPRVYGETISELYTVDTQTAESTFLTTLVPPTGKLVGFTSAGGYFYGISSGTRNEETIISRIDPFGYMTEIRRLHYPDTLGRVVYVPYENALYSILRYHLVRLDLETGDYLRVPVSLESYFWERSLAYDKLNDILYLLENRGINPVFLDLSVIDRETGSTELIGVAECERCDYGFLEFEATGDTVADEVPWLQVDTSHGKTAVGESSYLNLTFKVRDVIEQPGDYHAEISLVNDTPRGDLTIPITLHVLRPYSWGNFKGTVTGGEQCDLNPVPLPGAEIRFYRDQELVKSTRTDENGYFSYAIEKGNYDIEVVQANYVTQRLENVRLGPSEDLMLDIVLRHDSACLSWEPDMPFASQYADELSLQTLTLRNTGARNTELVFDEILGEAPQLVNMLVDDDSSENSLGFGGTVPFIWLNRFTPEEDAFPFWLESVSVFWESEAKVKLNDRFDIVIYQNKVSNHDPALGGEFLYKQRVWVTKLDSFENYILDEPVLLEGPGDVIIGVISLETPCVPNLPCYWPASFDMNSSKQRSWVGVWGTEVPEIPVLPPSGFWMVMDEIIPSNFLVRGYGITADNLQDVPWLTLGQESGFIEKDGGTFETELLFDSTGMSWGDYDAQVRVSNAPDPRVYVPVKLRVLPFNMMYLPLIQVFYAE